MKNHSKYRWKKFAVATTFALVSMVSVTSSLASTAVNEDITYYVYDASSGSYLREYTLYETTTLANIKTRSTLTNATPVETDWSNLGVGKISHPASVSGYVTVGTFFVVDSHTVATAAHCVYGYGNISLKFYDESGNVTETITPVEYHVASQYATSSSSSYDYALITVEEDLSDYVTFNLGTMTDDFAECGTELTITSITSGVKTTGTGYLVNNYEYRFSYYINTVAGNSGAPVYVVETLDGTTYCTVVGIHTSGGTTSNSGVKLSISQIQFYVCNSNLVY